MAIERKPLFKMNQESLDYLANNTPITFLADGGLAVGIVKAANRQVADLQDMATTLFANTRLSTARGIFLDMIGELLNVPRFPASTATIDKSEGVIRFYVQSGSLGTYLPHPSDPAKGRIPRGVRITDADGDISFQTTEDIEFPRGVKSVFVSATAMAKGSGQSVGTGVLTRHDLGTPSVLVRNESSITTGRDFEEDDSYKFRISNAVFSLAGGNRTAVRTSILSFPGIQSADIVEFTRGSGSFDVFVVPVNQRLGATLRERITETLRVSKAFGISAQIKEPNYVSVCISVQLQFDHTVEDGQRALIRSSARQSIKEYFEGIPLGGEIVINQIRGIVMSQGRGLIRDMRILDFCFNGRPQLVRNISLASDEVLILDENIAEPIEVI